MGEKREKDQRNLDSCPSLQEFFEIDTDNLYFLSNAELDLVCRSRQLNTKFESSTSLKETQALVRSPTAAVSRILGCSEDVSRRLASIETGITGTNRCTATATLMSSESSDGTSTISPLVRDTSDDLIAISRKPKSQLDPSLESEMYKSRVYSHAFRRFSTLSLPSNTCSAAGMSFLSAISLGQVSNISVIELPIFYHEDWNTQSCRIPNHPRLWKCVRAWQCMRIM